jgi:hypothetical protein
LSIRPSSMAAMRTLRAKGEAGENDNFMMCPEVFREWEIAASAGDAK